VSKVAEVADIAKVFAYKHVLFNINIGYVQ
jgi:hypothetical protein